MKKALVILALALLASISAQAQSKGSGIGSNPGAGLTFGGGGGVGSGGINGNTTRLPSYSRAQFNTAAVSGDASFIPSGFLNFQQAVEAGKLASAPPKSVAQVAADNVAAMKAKSRVEFVQDAGGNVVPLPR